MLTPLFVALFPFPPFELAATTCARESEPDEKDLVTSHPGHHPQERLVVFYFGRSYSEAHVHTKV